MKRWSIIVLLLLCTSNLFTAGFAAPQAPLSPPQVAPAQESEPAPVAVESARPVTEIIGEKSAYLATVSPDGTTIAWGKQSGRGKDRVLQLCLFEFETAAKGCSDLSPDDLRRLSLSVPVVARQPDHRLQRESHRDGQRE